MPDIEFKFFGDETKKGKYDNVEHLGWIDMDEWMPKLSCNLRITDHDGLSLTVLQFLTAGRNVVTNTPVTGTIQVEPTRKSIIKGVRMAHERLLDPRVSERWSRQLSIDRFKRSVRRLV
jgi:hypothetical protein